jgi:hypothetical protein
MPRSFNIRAAGPRQAVDEAAADRVGDIHEEKYPL